MDIIVEEKYQKAALRLHRTHPVVDAHLDLAGEILLRNRKGETDIIRKYYLKHFRYADLNMVVSSVYVESQIPKEEQWENALAQIQALKRDLTYVQEDCILVQSKAELEEVLQDTSEGSHKIGILLYMEGLDCIGEDIGRLELLYDMGVRGASLTWSRPNALAKGCCKAGEYRQVPGGLTEAGRAAVAELERLGMFLDISHLNDDGFAEVCRITTKPFIATHSCAKAVYDNYRNLTEEQMKKLANQGGIMGLNGCTWIAGSVKNKEHLEMLGRHVLYEAGKIGSAHVGYGFDLCESYRHARHPEDTGESDDCIENHSEIIKVTATLLQKGMPETDVVRIIGENFAHYFLKNFTLI